MRKEKLRITRYELRINGEATQLKGQNYDRTTFNQYLKGMAAQ